jgi:hypothetical protein
MRQFSDVAITRIARIFIPLVLSAAPLAAQSFRGTLRTTALGAPVAGAIVLLEDSTQQVRATSRSDNGGAFVLRAPARGAFRLCVQRIGMRPYESALFALRGDTTAVIALNELPFSLPRISSRATSACDAQGAAAQATWQLWEDVRTALLATSLTYSKHRSRFRVAVARRVYDVHPTALRTIALLERTLSAAQPWTSFDPDTLALHGYVTFANDRLTFVSPDIDVLLSRSFENTHCFEATLANQGGLIGLSFDPGRRLKNHTDIAGTFWVDSASHELRQLAFHHTGLPNVMGDSTGASIVTFATFGTKEWFMPDWMIRAPIPALALNRDLPLIEQLRLFGDAATGRDSRQFLWKLSGVDEEHGAVLAVYPGTGAADRDAIWSAPTGAIHVRVATGVKPTSPREPAGGAQVQLVGSDREGLTDDSGAVAFDGLTTGDYKLSVSTLSYNLFVEPPKIVDVHVEPNAATTSSVALKSEDELSVERCGDPLQLVLVGSVVHDGLPVAAARVSVYEPAYLDGVRIGVFKGTKADGRFVICTKRNNETVVELHVDRTDILEASAVVRLTAGTHISAVDLILRPRGAAKSP